MYKYIIFDLGGVLIDWNPRHLYKKVFADEAQMDSFLSQVCTPDWNEMQDAGRSLQEGTSLLVNQFPTYEDEIRMFYDRWEEMLNGSISKTETLLRELAKRTDLRLFALTNWSAETFPIAQDQFDFLNLFEGIVVSGIEKIKKPDPAIYRLLLDRFKINAGESIFIDDNLRNTQAAQNEGIRGIHYVGPELLRNDLQKLRIL